MISMTGRTRSQIDEALARAAAEVEIRALSDRLSSTDWYITRQAETGKVPPPEILADRQDCRDEISRLRVSYPPVVTPEAP